MVWFYKLMGIYKYIELFDAFVFCMFNLCSDIIFLFRPTVRKAVKRNKALKASREECFILGNGPSLKDVDLSRLKNFDTFTVNYFYKNPPQDFVSTYFVTVDDVFYKGQGRAYIKEVYKKYPQMKFILKHQAYLDNPKMWDLERTYFYYMKKFQYGRYVQCDATKNMTLCTNVINQCIQIAMHMGYKKIYLLGCDYNHFTMLKPTHFYEKEGSARSLAACMGIDLRWSSKTLFHHYALELKAKKMGVHVINLTENSMIDAYRRKTLDAVLRDVACDE